MRRKPVVAILSTGNELVDIGLGHEVAFNAATPTKEWTGIPDTNRPTMHAALETLGYTVVDLGIVHDE